MKQFVLKNKKIILDIIMCITLSFFICLLSPLNPFSQKLYGVDSWVFQYNAIAMKNGLLPYLDFFDHKGILLYVINLIGITINKNIGVWIIELLFMFVTVFFAKKTLDLLDKNEKRKMFVLILVLSFLSKCFEGGNLTEEYYLPFAMISQYIFFKYLLNKKVQNFEIIIIGVCFSVVCFLRINMIGLWGAFVLVILFKLILEKKYKDILKYILLFIIGILLVLIPILIYFVSNNILNEFIDNYFIFNMTYSKTTFFQKYDSFKAFFNILIVLVGIISNVLFIFNKNKFNKNILVANFLSLIIGLIGCSLSGNNYMHYVMVLIPSLFIPYIYLLMYFSKNDFMKTAIIGYLIIYILVPNLISYMDFQKTLDSYDNSNLENISMYIKENTEPTDKISVFGNLDVLYVLSERFSVSKYSYQYPIMEYDSKRYTKYVNDIITYKPKLIYMHQDSKQLESLIIDMGYIEKKERIFMFEGSVSSEI